MAKTKTTSKRKPYLCDNCGRKLDRYIVGKDLRITNGLRKPRYCWPGTGCQK